MARHAGFMTVIDFTERRQAAAQSEDPTASCPCGEAWFELRSDLPSAPHGAVCLDREGRVTGYHGTLYCISCGKRHQPG